MRLTGLQLSIHASVVLEWSTNYLHASKSKLPVQCFNSYILLQLLFILEYMLSVCVLFKLCIAKACALRQGSFDQGRGQTCQMTDAPGCCMAARMLSHAASSPVSQSSCRLITCVWQTMNSGCCPHVRCGTERVSATKLHICLCWGFTI